MPTRTHKSRKTRGCVSSGHGRVGKHRKHPGGRGNAGPEHHHRINVFKYHPGYVGKHGMRQYHDTQGRLFCKTVNVYDIWGMLSSEDREAIMSNDSIPTVDLSKLGVHKVLGNGAAPIKPMKIRARYFSKLAKEKIEAAGGECIAYGKPKHQPKSKGSN